MRQKWDFLGCFYSKAGARRFFLQKSLAIPNQSSTFAPRHTNGLTLRAHKVESINIKDMKNEVNRKSMSFTQRVINLLQKNLTWTILAVIATIASPFIYDYFKTSSTSSLTDNKAVYPDEMLVRDSVIEYVSALETSINEVRLSNNIDTLNLDINLISKFKYLCLDFANKTRELYNTPSVSKYENKSLDDILVIEKSWDNLMSGRKETLRKLITVIEELDSLGEKNNIDNYLINQSIYNDFLESEELVSKYSDEMMNQALVIYNKNNKTFSESNKKDFVKIIKFQEESCKNIYIYRRDNKLFFFLLNLNKNYDISLKSKLTF